MPKKQTTPEQPAEKIRFRSTFFYEGKRYETVGKDQREADQKAALKLDKLKRGEIGIASNMKVSSWAAEWLETYKKPAIGESQYTRYLSYINKIINPAIGSMSLKTVTDVHLQKILNSRAGKSKSDLKKLHNTINAIFHRAYLSRLIIRNPAENLELPAAEDGTHRSITPYERKKILQLAETHYGGLWVKTLLFTGMRPGETRALDWRHVDFKKKLIHVEVAMKAATKTIAAPKSSAGIRDVPIPNKLLPELKKAHDLLVQKKLEEAKAANEKKKASVCAAEIKFEPVFAQSTTGKRHTKTSMHYLWRNFKKELDILMGAKYEKKEAPDGKMRLTKTLSPVAKDLVPYCLRHTYCTDLQDAGVPINVARYLMGHSDIAMTAKIYTHTTERIIQDAAEKINIYVK